MKKNLFFIGLDISKADFAASIYKTPGQSIVTKEAIPNDPKGFEMLLLWLYDHHIDKTSYGVRSCNITFPFLPQFF